jgi:hypothetical protein
MFSDTVGAENAAPDVRDRPSFSVGESNQIEADFHVLDDENCRLLVYLDGLSGEIDDDRIWDVLTINPDLAAAAVTPAEIMNSGPWAPPTADDRQLDVFGRAPSKPDAPAWEKPIRDPHPNSHSPPHDQETGHARQSDDRQQQLEFQ